jgi:RNA polymerase sigma factor (sigma-70 family)
LGHCFLAPFAIFVSHSISGRDACDNGMHSADEPLQHDELLAQLGWVRALARRIVADPDVTDDVLQQVCLLALEKAPQEARSGPRLRAWLAVVTRRLARHSARGEVRRRERERLAAQPEALPATDDLVAHRDVLKKLVDSLTSLDKPSYSVLVARYFDGRCVAEIAALGGTTEAAVRQQLTRARQRLRARLAPLVADDRQGWLASPLPAAAIAGALQTAAFRSLPERVGGLIVAKTMGTSGVAKILVGIAVLLCLIGGSWYLLEGRGDESQAPARIARIAADGSGATPVLPESVHAAQPLQPLSSLPEDATARSATSAVLSYPPGIVTFVASGRVVDEHGVPWNGARVTFVPDPGTAGELHVDVYSHTVELDRLPHMITDVEGRFALFGPWAPDQAIARLHGNQLAPALVVEAEGMAVHAFLIEHHDGQDRDLGDLVLSMKAGTVILHTVDEHGAPIEGVTAGIFQGGPVAPFRGTPGCPDFMEFSLTGLARGRSDAAGRLVLTGLWPCSVTVSCRDARYTVGQAKDLTVGPGETVEPADVVMGRGVLLAGVVRDAKGEPVAGAEIWARTEERIYANKAGMVRPEDWVTADPLPSVMEALHESREWNNPESPTTTDADGRFTRSGLSGKSFDVFVAAEGFEPLHVPGVPADSAKLDLVLSPEATLQVLVIDETTGKPSSMASLQAYRCSKKFGYFSGESPAVERKITPGSGPGAFVVHGIGPQGTKLVASAPDCATLSMTVEASPAEDGSPVTLRLAPQCVVKGRIEDEKGTPLARAVVTLKGCPRVSQPAEGDADKRDAAPVANELVRHVSADGSFHFVALPSGCFVLSATAPGYEDATSPPLDMQAGATLDLPSLVLAKSCAIEGTVRRADGSPAAGAWVTAGTLAADGRSVSGDYVTADLHGHFSFLGRRSGPVTVSVADELRSAPLVHAGLVLAEHETRTVDFVLPRRPVLRGRVTSGGRPVRDAYVVVTEQSPDAGRLPASATVECGDDGRYMMEWKQQGGIEVRAGRPGGGNADAVDVDATWGLDLTLNFELGSASIAGRVEDARDAAVPEGMQVRLLRSGAPASDWVSADATGGFLIESVPAGIHDIQARSAAYPLATPVKGLSVEPGQRLQGVLIPVSRGAVVNGEVLDVQGRPDTCWVYVVKPVSAEPGDADLPTLVPFDEVVASGGHFRVEGLAAGHYRFVVARPGYGDDLQDASSAEQARANEMASLEVDLEPGEIRAIRLQKVR